MSDTPKTDAAACDGWSGDACCVSYEFARDQELLINELVGACSLFTKASRDAVERLNSVGQSCPASIALAAEMARAAIAKVTGIPADESVQS